MKTTKRIISIILAAALLMSLTACGGGKTQPGAAHDSSVRVGIPQDLDTLDPHMATASGTKEVMMNVFVGLMGFTDGGEMIPALAQDYSISDDGLVYTFKLRPGLLFHDGTDCTSADVKYSLDRLAGKILGEETAMKANFSDNIDTVAAPDDLTVEIRLKAADASFLSYLIEAVIPEGSGPDQAVSPVGAGPYRFVSYTPGVGLKLAKFEDYYEEGLPAIENVDIKIFSDASIAALALSNGEYDYMSVTYDMLGQIPQDFRIEEYSSNTIQLLGLNNEFEPFKDIRVRQALNYAVDRQAIIDFVAPGSDPVCSNFAPLMDFWYEDLADFYTYDPEKAKELLADAGYPDLHFSCKVASEYPQNVDAATLIKNQLAKVGVTMDLDIIDWNTWLQDVYKNFKHEATLIGFTGKLDPDPILRRFTNGYASNFIRFNSDDYTNAVQQARYTTDQDERADLYKKAQRILAEQAASVFLQDVTYYAAIHRDLEGFTAYPITFIDIKNWHWAE